MKLLMTLFEASPYWGIAILLCILGLWATAEQKDKHKIIMWWRNLKSKLKR